MQQRLAPAAEHSPHMAPLRENFLGFCAALWRRVDREQAARREVRLPNLPAPALRVLVQELRHHAVVEVLRPLATDLQVKAGYLLVAVLVNLAPEEPLSRLFPNVIGHFLGGY